LEKHNFRINTNKPLFQKKIESLGMAISEGKVTPISDNVEAVQKLRPLKIIKNPKSDFQF